MNQKVSLAEVQSPQARVAENRKMQKGDLVYLSPLTLLSNKEGSAPVYGLLSLGGLELRYAHLELDISDIRSSKFHVRRCFKILRRNRNDRKKIPSVNRLSERITQHA